jgi:hypothetical protein
MHRADAYAVLGDTPAALEKYRDATAAFRQLAAQGVRDHANLGKCLEGQADLLTQAQSAQARALLEEALALFQIAGRSYQEGKIWEALGDLGDGAPAWRMALERYENLKLPEAADRVRAKLQ